jgi:hypothetical protein
MAAFSYPSGTNTFVPSFDATGHLVVSYSRNPKDFSLNKYVSLTPVKKSSGYWLKITAEVAARVINSDKLREFVWHDGDDAPDGNWNAESFKWLQFATERYVYPFQIGYKANEQADWKILAAYADYAAQDAMTARTLKVLNVLTDTSNHDTSHYDTATNLVGGSLASGTPTDPRFKKLVNKVMFQIQKATLGMVRPKDMMVLCSPTFADELSRSQEVHTYLKESPFSLAQVRGDSESQNGVWGLPDQLYGMPIVIEDAVRVSSKKGATRSADYVLGSDKILFLTRKGGLTSPAGGPSFSSCHIFSYEEMTTEQRDDPDNRRIKGRVVEDFDVRLVSPASTYLVTSALG